MATRSSHMNKKTAPGDRQSGGKRPKVCLQVEENFLFFQSRVIYATQSHFPEYFSKDFLRNVTNILTKGKANQKFLPNNYPKDPTDL